MKDSKPPTKAEQAQADAMIRRLIANPPVRREVDPGKRWPETARANAIGAAAVAQLRAMVCKREGMTLEQLLEAEANVCHPSEFIPTAPSPRAIARRRMQQAGVPARFIEAVADKEPIDCDPLKNVREFLNSRDGFRVLAGGKGIRKTGSACWALGQLDGGMFVEAPDVIRLSIEDKAKWDAILNAPLVVFDDLGTEKRDRESAFTSAFSRLINTVYGQQRRMIITCNMTPATFKQVYGEREYDRMRETGQWSTVAGESVRRYAAPEHWADREPGEEG